MDCFYCTEAELQNGILSKEESMHCIKVMRYKVGDLIEVVNGNGGKFECVITQDSKDGCKFEIVNSYQDACPSFQVHIAVAPTKNIGRYEWFLEKATEMGVHEITPIISQHSERRTWNENRLKNILVTAMKQSQQSFLPILHDAIPFEKFVNQTFDAEKFICHVDNENPLHLKEASAGINHSVILIGPEGDFSENEIEMAMKNHFVKVSLGKNRYRTETAAMLAAHIVLLKSE